MPFPIAFLALSLLPRLSPALRTSPDQAHLPPANVFKELWERRVGMEPRDNIYTPKVQLVLGVFATQNIQGNMRDVHDVIVRTWMNRPGVCWLHSGKRDGCSVYVAFVLGQPAVGRKEDVVLEIRENMNGGKSFSWFKHASKHYAWATHIAKMDLDTFPFLGRLTRSLSEHAGAGCEHFVGVAIDYNICGRKWFCPPKGCGMPLNGDFLSFNSSQLCWAYMQGGLYLLSARLAAAATEDGGFWSAHRNGIEDLTTGKALSKSAAAKKICVKTWDPLAWDHVRNPASYDASVSERWGHKG